MSEQESFPTHEKNEKQRRWDESAERIERTADALGRGVDQNIKETVIGLNLLDINTTASCEGHLDHGTNAPYIDIEAKEVAELENRVKEAGNIENKETESIIEKIKQKNLEERRKALIVLDEFYRDRQAPFHKRLTIQGMARDRSRLESQGADLQKIEPEEIKKQRLSEYQEEMREFSSFLKDKFFGEEK